MVVGTHWWVRVAALGFVIALVCVALGVGGAGAWTTNLVQLDNGTCGQNLQVGSDRTASKSATPSFWIMGDGGLSKYDVSIDGLFVGSFGSDMYANVCVRTSSRLSDGSHVLTGRETSPHSVALSSLAFSVDTIAPSAPSAPALASWSDTGTVGDNVTSYRQVTLLGRSQPLMAVQVYANGAMVGGARADNAGNWSAATTALTDGTYNTTAAAIDNAGNKSPLSAAATLTISQSTTTTATTPAAPTGLVLASAGANGIWFAWTAPASGSPIAGYGIYRSTAAGAETPYAINGITLFVDQRVTRGVRYYYRVAAVNSAGRGPLSAEVSVVS